VIWRGRLWRVFGRTRRTGRLKGTDGPTHPRRRREIASSRRESFSPARARTYAPIEKAANTAPAIASSVGFSAARNRRANKIAPVKSTSTQASHKIICVVRKTRASEAGEADAAGAPDDCAAGRGVRAAGTEIVALAFESATEPSALNKPRRLIAVV